MRRTLINLCADVIDGPVFFSTPLAEELRHDINLPDSSTLRRDTVGRWRSAAMPSRLLLRKDRVSCEHPALVDRKR